MRISAAPVALAMAVGCTTETGGAMVAVNTPGVAGATCTLSSASMGARIVVTPAAVALPKGSDTVLVHCTKECYRDGVGVIVLSREDTTPGNTASREGSGVDAADGATNSYVSAVQIAMIAIPLCRPSGSPPATRR